MDKPDVDFIEGLSPAISIDQKSASRNPRSPVGPITEVYDYLRLLYARIGVPHCPTCGRVVSRQTPQQIVDRVLELPEGTRFQVLAPVVRGRKGEYEGLIEELASQGFVRARIDGEVHELADKIKLARYEMHTIEVVVVPNPELTLAEGAVAPWAGARGEYFYRVMTAVADSYGFRMTTPWQKLKKAQQKVLLYGSGTKQVHVQYRNRYGRTRSYFTHYEGVVPYLQRRHSEAESDYLREQVEGYMREVPCPDCGGAR